MRPIGEIAERLGLDPKVLIPYGHYKAKIPLDALGSREGRGKLIVVTGMTPTPAGEGKTTTTVGLTQAMGLLGVNVAATIREPVAGPDIRDQGRRHGRGHGAGGAGGRGEHPLHWGRTRRWGRRTTCWRR